MLFLLHLLQISLGTFATYVLLDPNNVLTADKAFVSMSRNFNVSLVFSLRSNVGYFH
jgi:hypothetical protein